MKLVGFFNLCREFWGENLRLDEALIQPLTDIAEVTASILDFNNDERILERELLKKVATNEQISLTNVPVSR
ncbi:hypothetical protein [Cylindrospermum sp. FACHB-282]|uniref:hypothetical protein n=1 Tax=Cylindrospermum sp. FACHB-282 TaxID=2692794 RepID=UPI001A7E8CC1|nr:hypothetical protein [Cylindrospermum sp. FACHB-282]